MNVVAKAAARHCPGVEKRSKFVAWKRLAAALLVLIMCVLVAAALWPRPSPLTLAFAGRGGTYPAQLDEAIGATVEPLDAATARSLGLAASTPGAVITSVASGGPAARAGVRTGDVVVAVDRPVASPNDLAAGLGKNDKVLTVTLNRHGQSVIVPLAVNLPDRQPALFEEGWR